MIIRDGYNSKTKARVDTENRLLSNATVRSGFQFASAEKGDAYDFSTGAFITISSANTETGVFYLKNDSTTRNLLIHSIRTCANKIHRIQLYKNPTGGTLITAQTAGTKTNMDFGSAKTAEATVYRGAEGATISGGDVVTQHINDVGHSTGMFDGALILGPLDSIGITFELEAAGDCCVRVTSFYQ